MEVLSTPHDTLRSRRDFIYWAVQTQHVPLGFLPEWVMFDEELMCILVERDWECLKILHEKLVDFEDYSHHFQHMERPQYMHRTGYLNHYEKEVIRRHLHDTVPPEKNIDRALTPAVVVAAYKGYVRRKTRARYLFITYVLKRNLNNAQILRKLLASIRKF